MPTVLREQSRSYRQAASKESERHLKRYLARHALALAQLAEKIERKKSSVRETPARTHLIRAVTLVLCASVTGAWVALLVWSTTLLVAD